MKGCSGILLAAVAACSSTGSSIPLPAPAQRMIDDGTAPTADVVEVWVCRVPATTTSPIYGDLPLRQLLEPADIVSKIGDRIADYWHIVSGGAYRVSFATGGVVELADDEDDADCLAHAFDRSAPRATVVLAIADAEHAEGHAGGRGAQGNSPNCGGCAAATTRRGVSIGASDFHPDWGPVPLLDLIEHELGHTLGLPHSGDGSQTASSYTSDLDVMSNSAAPRASDPTRRDAPSTLAINLFDLGWLPPDDVVVLDPSNTGGGTEIEIVPATSGDGIRLTVLAVDDHRMLTVELRSATGLDSTLPESGVAVHLVDDSVGTGIERTQVPIGSSPPHTDLLGVGDSLVADGWSIEVLEVGATARLAISATDR